MKQTVPIDPVQEEGYNVRRLRSDLDQVIHGWSIRSETFRATARSTLNCTYGTDHREKLDIFHCGHEDAPLLVFFHGGYWQSGNKSIYSFIAEPFNQGGVDVALVGYPLCPQAQMGTIVTSSQKALIWLWRNAKKLGVAGGTHKPLRSFRGRTFDRYRTYHRLVGP